MRCSACAKVGVELPFCSTEHQKLVWSSHKHVCGPERAKPFYPPDLTIEEANILRLVGHIPTPTAEAHEDPQAMGGMRMVPGPTAVQQIERMFQMEPGEFAQMTIERLTSLSSAFSPDERPTAMVFLRLCLHVATAISGQLELYNKLGPTCFAAQLHWWLIRWAPDTPANALTLAMHRHVLFVGLLRAKSHTVPGTTPIPAEHLRGALERVLAPVAQYFRFQNAADALETLDRLLIPLEPQLTECSLALEIDFNNVTSRIRAIRAVFSGSLGA